MGNNLKKDLKELSKVIIWFILAGIGVLSLGVGGRELNYNIGKGITSDTIASIILIIIGLVCMGLIAYFYERE